ncbi:MAG TPA: DUF2332 domain-containing protein [Thermoleophilaceae bacterium]|jgi:hypothetical protein|nr:DUF2332 domain-containing protein [Thermoleophilaceae bacterium]
MTGAVTDRNADAGSDPRATLVSLFRGQAGWCARLGSPIYGHMLERAADDLAAGGPVWRVVEPYLDKPSNFAHHLRLMGATHRLALTGQAPALAAHYPSTGGDGDEAGGWEAFIDLIEERPISLDRAVQTNEVGRSAALLGGFLSVADQTGLALRVLEIGASAGLNLRWDRFRYEAADWAFGDAASPARVPCEYEGGRPPLPRAVWVIERAGCDPSPLDATTEDGALTLESFMWPDQLKRLELLRAAIEVARRTPATVDEASAPDWLDERLARERGGSATVVFHSIMWGYMADEDRARVTRTLHEAGERASESSPLAWLRMEAGADQADLTLTMWPGGEERVIAMAGYHGRPVRWFG